MIMRTGIAFGPFVFDPDSGTLKKDGSELPLPPRVTGVLEVLLRRAGDVVLRQELMDSVWKDAFVTDTSLAEAVSVLRQALGDDPQAPSYIQTLHRRGYRWVAPVVQKPAPGIVETATAARGGQEPQSGTVPVSPSIGGQLVPWGLAIVCTILAGLAVQQAVTTREVSAPVARFAVALVPGTRLDARARALAISPDSSRAVWSACDDAGCRLYLRELNRLDAVAIAGTDGAAAPFFSPDGRSVGFFASGRLKKVALGGGAPVILADAADPLGAVWTPAREIIFAGAAAGLKVIGEAGGNAQVLTAPRPDQGEVRHVWPAHQASTNVLLFTISGGPGAGGAGRLAALRLDARRNPWTVLLGAVGNCEPASDDVLVFSRGSELQAVSFDGRRGALTGAPQVILSDVASSAGAAQFATSAAGALIAVSAAPHSEKPAFFWSRVVTSANAGSLQDEDAARVRELEGASLSPDGRHIAGVDSADSARPEIWIADLERGTSSRLTHEGINVSPVWHPDGTTIFYASSDGGTFAIYGRDADSSRPSRRLHAGAAHALPSSVSTDGSRLTFVSRDPATGLDVWALPLDGGPAQPLVRTPFDDAEAIFAPHGDLLAYQSNEAGRWEVYVQRRPDERRVTVSTEGGTHPFWSADGRALFFQSGDRLMRVAVSPDGSGIGNPTLVKRIVEAMPVGADRAGRLLWQRNRDISGDVAVLTLQWLREARQLLGPPSASMPR
jgi:serine/threonine-protein kinase